MEKILTVNSRLSCSTLRDSFTNKDEDPISLSAVRSIRKQRSREDPNKAILILKCEMDLSESGSDHYSNQKLHVNVNRGKLYFSGCRGSMNCSTRRNLSFGLIAREVRNGLRGMIYHKSIYRVIRCGCKVSLIDTMNRIQLNYDRDKNYIEATWDSVCTTEAIDPQ